MRFPGQGPAACILSVFCKLGSAGCPRRSRAEESSAHSPIPTPPANRRVLLLPFIESHRLRSSRLFCVGAFFGTGSTILHSETSVSDRCLAIGNMCGVYGR
ncbi:hypothetical protein L596_005428 [Steinernema carpocapsae]|uniref:Uncharacterized protein n=1 Tax=Steinernema carpocapsae TaxID=34508 RepID=A0A4V6I8P1_STECR|nr:hypothetical protein L596_005428 [Steinernema carpocapsae]